jgi:hypothetical protein
MLVGYRIDLRNQQTPKIVTMLTKCCSDSVALWGTQLSNHSSGTSSERTTSPEDREIVLAGVIHPMEVSAEMASPYGKH